MSLGITREQVVEACQNLVSKGIEPSIKIIRRELGDTGSEATIHKHLQAWRKERAGGLTEELQRRENEARQKENELKAVRDKEYTKMEADNADLATALDEKMQVIDQLNETIDRLEREAATAQNTIKEMRIAFQDMLNNEFLTQTKNALIDGVLLEITTVKNELIKDVSTAIRSAMATESPAEVVEEEAKPATKLEPEAATPISAAPQKSAKAKNKNNQAKLENASKETTKQDQKATKKSKK